MSLAEALSGKDSIELDYPQTPPCKKQCFDPSWMKVERISRSLKFYELTFTEELLTECKKHNLYYIHWVWFVGVVGMWPMCPQSKFEKLAPMQKGTKMTI